MKDRIISNKFLPFIFLVLFISYYHFYRITEKFGDDIHFQQVLDNYELFSWLKERYLEWSSRTFIELIMVIIAHEDYSIWKMLNVLIFVLLTYALSYLFSDKDLKGNNWFVVLLVLAYPINQMSSAGWIATTLNYLWPLTFGLICLFPIKKYVKNRKIHWLEYPIYILSLLFAANQEQMCAVILAFYFIFTLYSLIVKKLNYFIMFQFLLSIISFIYIVMSPGNTVRSSQELQKWFPFFDDFSLLEQLSLGFTTTISLLINEIPGIFTLGISNQFGIFNNINLLFLIFSLLLVILMYKRTNSMIYLIIASIPLISIFIFNLRFDHFFIRVAEIGGITTVQEFNKLHFGGFRYYLSIIAGLGIMISIVISFFKVFTDRKQFYMVFLIFMAGVFSRVIMGFSPTIFASSSRTAIFLYFSLIASSIFLINELRKKGIKKQ